MRGRVAFYFSIFFLLSNLLYLRFNQFEVKAPTGYPVHNLDTGFNYTSIQVAINANETLNGHTIFVEEGNYSEIVYVNKSVSLVGEDKHNTTIHGNSIGPIIWARADNISITGFTVHNSNPWEGSAIRLSSNCNIVHGNVIRDSAWGVSVLSSYNVISENTIKNSRWGIDLVGCTNNIVQSNYVSNSSVTSIGLGFADWNFICDNLIIKNDLGFRITESSNNTICRNDMADNGWESGGSAIYLYFFQSDNKFYQNSFRNNYVHVLINHAYSNIWENGLEGNYWSDYNGTDYNLDGIGDSNYVISSNNTDHYPLMGPFSSFNTSIGKHVNIISNSTINDLTYFNFNNTIKMHVSNMTNTQTHGFVRICIPHALMTEPYNITVNGVNPIYWNDGLHDNGTHRWIYFAYEHSTLEIIIVPEFPSLVILSLFMTITLLAAFVHRRRIYQSPQALADNW